MHDIFNLLFFGKKCGYMYDILNLLVSGKCGDMYDILNSLLLGKPNINHTQTEINVLYALYFAVTNTIPLFP